MEKIAVPIEQERIHRSFENASLFRIYEIEDKKVKNFEEISLPAPVIGRLKALGVDAVLCGFLKNETRRDLAMAGIMLLAGIYGEAEETIKLLLSDKLQCEPDTMRSSYAAHYSPCVHKGEH